ncbi:hypothetical protein [Mucilaginibacter dorajii]|uniref:hypothetical protein n=1 Tax=Mucilaginibacter dorajii TaxID=692994 RepID=UPI00216A9316|nr:hypothetical protein [Mucilaginibacter dorajii]MCS3733583.1 hypothetical protein [Mucilaginibacter dorajii]
MKLFCLFLAVFVIMLSAKPCCADNDCRLKQADKKEQGSKEKDCAGCSPFFICGACVGFVVAKPVALHIKRVAETPEKTHFFYQLPFVKQVSLAIWQPPQLG